MNRRQYRRIFEEPQYAPYENEEDIIVENAPKEVFDEKGNIVPPPGPPPNIQDPNERWSVKFEDRFFGSTEQYSYTESQFREIADYNQKVARYNYYKLIADSDDDDPRHYAPYDAYYPNRAPIKITNDPNYNINEPQYTAVTYPDANGANKPLTTNASNNHNGLDEKEFDEIDEYIESFGSIPDLHEPYVEPSPSVEYDLPPEYMNPDTTTIIRPTKDQGIDQEIIIQNAPVVTTPNYSNGSDAYQLTISDFSHIAQAQMKAGYKKRFDWIVDTPYNLNPEN